MEERRELVDSEFESFEKEADDEIIHCYLSQWFEKESKCVSFSLCVVHLVSIFVSVDGRRAYDIVEITLKILFIVRTCH